jgi:hypothetical protein
MNQFVNTILNELTVNESICNEPLVNMLVESTQKSIKLGDTETSIYTSLKAGLTTINEKVNNPYIGVLVSQFAKHENTPDVVLSNIAKGANLSTKLQQISESNLGSNPVVIAKSNALSAQLASGTPDFMLCDRFIQLFEEYSYEQGVKTVLDSVKQYIVENSSRLNVLSTIYRMESMNTPAYQGITSNLKNMLLTESYSADIIKLKFGTALPIVNELVHNLRILESREYGNFTLGEGDGLTKVSNLIAPATQISEGMILFTDNRFISIRESKGLLGNESKVYHDEDIKISEVDPKWVFENLQDFYKVCEAYTTLGFTKTVDGLGVATRNIRNFDIEFKMNESNTFDLYLKGQKVDSLGSVNIYEALTLESTDIKTKVALVLEKSNLLFNFDFIKELSNDRLNKDALVVKVDESYFICDKVNVSERQWLPVDEFKLYEFFNSNFNYDISPIFETKITQELTKLKAIQEKKEEIEKELEGLEQAAKKLDDEIAKGDLSPEDTAKLEEIKESIFETTVQLKDQYISLDLYKKKVK